MSEHPNSKLNLVGFERRGTKRKRVNIDFENDVAYDNMMFRSYFPRSDTNMKKCKKLVANHQYRLQDLDKIYLMIDH